MEVSKGMLDLLRHAKPEIIIEVHPNEREALEILKELAIRLYQFMN